MAVDFTCPLLPLRRAVERVARIVERRNTIPILSNIGIRAEADGRLTIIGTDLDLWAIAGIDVGIATVTAAGETTVPAVLFLDMLKKFGGDVAFADDGGGSAKVSSGRSRITLHTLPMSDLPEVTAMGEAAASFQLTAATLRRINDACSFAISTEETRYYLNGIFLHADTLKDNRLTAVATDGHRLSRLARQQSRPRRLLRAQRPPEDHPPRSSGHWREGPALMNIRPLIIDSFAGGGGASTGIEMALNRSPDIAINHNAAALAMHEANHPGTQHLSKNIWQVDPLEAVGNRPVGLAWFSPDCKHFSKAKGGKPVKRNVRDLAWTVVLWAKRARPAIIILENVEEFQDWGPLVEAADGSFRPCPDRRGETFKEWIGQLKRLGYKVEFRQLVAADYGAPTTRNRLFLIARRDGQKIVWPAPTHGKPTDPEVIAGRKLPWRTAAEIIDWSLPCPSIFKTSEQIMAQHGLRAVRPLADATMARVARGVKRYVLDAAKPFIVKFQTGSTGHAIDEPLHTITANSFNKRPGGAAPVGLVVPLMTAAQHGGANRSADEPMRTIAASDKDQHAVIAPHLMTMRNSGKPFNDTDKPTHTITAGGAGLSLVAATMVQSGYGEREGQEPRALDIEAPLGTIVAGGVKHALVAAHLSRQFGASVGQDIDAPAPTTTMVNKTAVVAAFMAQHNNDSRRTGGVNPGQPADRPASTITASGSQQGVVAAALTKFYGSNETGAGGDLADPLPTITTSDDRGGGHAGLVSAFMSKYYGTGGQGQNIDDPLHTLTAKAPMGLVTVTIGDTDYVITDIGMRMLTPRELFSAQGFPSNYLIDGISYDGRVLTKSEQISCVGNSVCPPLAAALVAANAAHLREEPMLEAAE